VSGVEHSVLVQRPIQAVNAALGAGPRKWFPHLDGSSAIDPEGLELRRKVKVDVGKPVTQGDRTEVPVTWHATFIKDLFPVMTGKVELPQPVLEPLDSTSAAFTNFLLAAAESLSMKR
jgi:hypothetical protein